MAYEGTVQVLLFFALCCVSLFVCEIRNLSRN